MAFVNVTRGLGTRRAMRVALPIPARHRRHGLRGLGQQICAPGLTLVTNPDGSTMCQGAGRAVSDWDPGQAFDYAQAPGCHVVDLSKNICKLDDGSVDGCNGIQECDPLTGAVHAAYGLPGGPVSGQPASLQTVGSGFKFPVFGYSPNLSLTNPTGGTPATFLSAAQIQANIQKALGPALYKVYQAAQGGRISSQSTAPSGDTSGGNGSASGAANTPGGGGSTPPTAGFDLSFFTNPISLFGFNIPLWLLIAAGGGVLYAASSGGKR